MHIEKWFVFVIEIVEMVQNMVGFCHKFYAILMHSALVLDGTGP